jgi:hypothetical protein
MDYGIPSAIQAVVEPSRLALFLNRLFAKTKWNLIYGMLGNWESSKSNTPGRGLIKFWSKSLDRHRVGHCHF